MNTKLWVTINSAAFVPDYEAQEAGILRYLGRKWNHKTQSYQPIGADKMLVLPNRAEYRAHVRDGSLIPVNDSTAKACGLKNA